MNKSLRPVPGGVLNVRFRAVGTDPVIALLNEKLTGRIEGPPICVGDMHCGVPSKVAYVSIVIVDGCDDKATAMSQLCAWFDTNGAIVKEIKANKWIEIGTYLLPNQAYDTLSLDPGLLHMVISADCRIDNTCYALFMPLDSMYRRVLPGTE